MIYKMHNGHFVTVREEDIRTCKCGLRMEASVKVITSSTTGVYQYTCNTTARSCRLARVAMKQELQRAKDMQDKPGYTH